MFETVTAASPWEIPAAKRSRLVGGAFALHFLAIGSYLVLSVWTIRPVTAPELIEAFVPQPVPPRVVTFEPVRPVESRHRGESAPNPTSVPVAAPTQPTAIAELAPTPAAPIEEFAPSGIDGLLLEGDGLPATGAPAEGVGEASIPFGGGMTRPQILQRTEPRYPELARRLHKQGVVVVEAEIGKDGRVRSARAVSALGFGLEESALDALRTWRFSPATLHGQPVSVFYRLSVDFKLQ
jgi:protein TonB